MQVTENACTPPAIIFASCYLIWTNNFYGKTPTTGTYRKVYYIWYLPCTMELKILGRIYRWQVVVDLSI